LQRLRAVPFGGDHARMLGVDPGSPGLLIERRGFLRDGRAVEFTRSYYRGDSYDFVAELADT
jgi:GntR family transcriptional regulator